MSGRRDRGVGRELEHYGLLPRRQVDASVVGLLDDAHLNTPSVSIFDMALAIDMQVNYLRVKAPWSQPDATSRYQWRRVWRR